MPPSAASLIVRLRSSTPIADVQAACVAADAAFDAYPATDRETRAAFLERIGAEIQAIGPELIATASRETGLPEARIESEGGRTIDQLNMFASVVRAGHWMGVRIDLALPERTPAPRPDLRLRMIPLAFSTARGDTASALAAGAPVVVKAHPAHPATAG